MSGDDGSDFTKKPGAVPPEYPEEAPATGDDTIQFRKMDPDEDVHRITVVESMCEMCGRNGETRLLLLSIPHFRDVIIMSFTCPFCAFRSTQLQPAGVLADKAVKYELTVEVEKEFNQDLEEWVYPRMPFVHEDLNRQVVKSDTAVITVPELQLEIPRMARGEVTTVEGLLSVTAENLSLDQPTRKEEDPVTAEKIQEIIDALTEMSAGHRTFTIIIEDTAGNSFLSNPNAPGADPRARVFYRDRTRAETEALGYAVPDEVPESEIVPPSATEWKPKKGGLIAHEDGAITVGPELSSRLDTFFDVTTRAAVIPGICPNCHAMCETRVCATEIPYFKEILLMVSDCASCGYKDSEVKPSGSISAKGRRVTLHVSTVGDLQRDLLKTDSCRIEIPEIDLHLGEGTLGGKYTTVEGLMNNIREQLDRMHAFQLGDSAPSEERSKMQVFFQKFDNLVQCRQNWTLILDDPLGNAFIMCEGGDPSKDPRIVIEEYDRTWQENEELGLNDMKTENYEEDSEKPATALLSEDAAVRKPYIPKMPDYSKPSVQKIEEEKKQGGGQSGPDSTPKK